MGQGCCQKCGAVVGTLDIGGPFYMQDSKRVLNSDHLK